MEIKLNLKNRNASTLDNEEWAWIAKSIYGGVTSYRKIIPNTIVNYPAVEFNLEVV